MSTGSTTYAQPAVRSAPRRRFSRKAKVITGIAAAGGVLVIAVSCSGGQPAGFHSMTTLQTSVGSQVQVNENNGGTGETVSQTVCVSTGASTAQCNVQFADGTSATASVFIAADGNIWVSK